MNYLRRFLQGYARDQSGATAIEYGLIAALISLAIAVSIFAFGESLNNLFFVQLLGILTL